MALCSNDLNIYQKIADIPEIAEILPQEALSTFLKDGGNLKQLIHTLMTSDREKIAISLQAFLSRLEKEGK